jgi:hypothetical protein
MYCLVKYRSITVQAMTMILESSRKQHVKEFSFPYSTVVSTTVTAIETPAFNRIEEIIDPSERDVISVLALHTSMHDGKVLAEEASVFLLHTAALQYLQLGNRWPSITTRNPVQSLVRSFTLNAAFLLRDHNVLEQLDLLNFPANLADLLDGFLIASLTRDVCFRKMLLGNPTIKKKYDSLLEAFVGVSGASFDKKIVTGLATDHSESKDSIPRLCSVSSSVQTVLPFKNTVFDQHLASVHRHLDGRLANGPIPDNVRVFQELSHRHNHRKAITMKGPAQKLGFFARRRNDLYTAEMHAYAASLTNVAGKILDPETIVVNQRIQPLKSQNSFAVIEIDKSQNVKDRAWFKNNKRTSKLRKSGKAAALEAAAAVKTAEAQRKEDINSASWQVTCKGLLTQSNLQVRYTLARDYSIILHQASLLRSEVELYIIDCLLRIWVEYCNGDDVHAGAGIAALIWDAFLRLCNMNSAMAPEIATSLQVISKVPRLPTLDYQANAARRPLTFTCVVSEMKVSKASTSSSINFTELSVPGDAAIFQLEHCGPYLEIAIDSAPDPRVPFHPDAWKRKVLDAIDENQFSFVVAPTSAGKTFVSFYAMNQVLTNDDDGVVVYVAPTKALFSQIAAEIQARFSKLFKHPGKSVCAIHTRDYRVNNATGCQILVTVPHILQIMLPAPSNAEKVNSWSCRIKRIIFDEIHCIGQAEDSVVWEQLLLQSPCPIIAFSATVGNPEEFSNWLRSTQEANGNKLVTIEHHHRYSDLRKFTYVPPEQFCFSGLPKGFPIPTPGLDGAEAFGFIHLVASLSDRSRGIPKDLHLEARDCLWLWQTMEKHATGEYSIPPNLSPYQALPNSIKKVLIFEWERALKAKLLEWMDKRSSPFEKVRQDLTKTLIKPETRDLLETNHVCNGRCNVRKVNPESLSSIILPALTDLHARNALPAIVFNYDRVQCENMMKDIVNELEINETAWKDANASWREKLAEFEQFSKEQEAIKTKSKDGKSKVIKTKRKSDDKEDEEKMSKANREREAGSAEYDKWDGFDHRAPVHGFHFANAKKLLQSELDEYKYQLHKRGVAEWLISSMNRGIGVHHAGMNRKYRQVVEILFRKSYLQVVIVTGTLALGINMPCKTIVFAGNSVFLTALNFRQCAGRAGRRGFDLLGNILFLGIFLQRVFRLNTL